MDEIKTRLQETSQNCYTTYEAWTADKKSTELQQNLQDAIHELRKVSSRLEIELAVNERSNVQHNMTNDSNNRRGGRGNNNAQDDTSKKPRARRSAPRKAQGGKKED